MHKIKRTFSVIILWSISIFWVACTSVASVFPEHIRYEINSTPYRIVNGSEYDIRVHQPHQSFLWDEEMGWNAIHYCRHCLFTDEFNEFLESTSVVPSQNEKEFLTGEKAPVCSIGEKCNYFVIRRYTVDEIPKHTFIVYSNEGLLKSSSQKQRDKISVSLLPTSPFHFVINNDTDSEVLFFWKSIYDIAWGTDSRLERKTEYGTWETYSHPLDLYKNDNGIKILAHQEVSIDGTQAYPNYKELPPSKYRWVIIVVHHPTVQQLIFSPLFSWDGEVATPLEE